jgi:general secretion pathway protein K
MRLRRRESGVVLVMVLIFLLLLVSSVATFLRRAVLDKTIVENRDSVARAETLARGGVQLAVALLLEDRLRETQGGIRAETPRDVWARAERLELPVAEDAELRLHIEDAAARLNLNALFKDGAPRDEAAEVLLIDLLQRAIEEAELDAQHEYDTRELARNLIDWIDADDLSLRGGREDDPYERREPPYRAANRALLTVDELRLVDGFDPPLVDALRPYVTVHPYAGGEGINPNTAPPWVLGVLYHGVAGDYRLATPELAEDVIRAREAGQLLCDESANDPACTPLSETLPGEIFPPPSFVSDVFLVRAEARVREVRRTLRVAIDRSDPAQPQLLSWRVQ